VTADASKNNEAAQKSKPAEDKPKSVANASATVDVPPKTAEKASQNANGAKADDSVSLNAAAKKIDDPKNLSNNVEKAADAANVKTSPSIVSIKISKEAGGRVAPTTDPQALPRFDVLSSFQNSSSPSTPVSAKMPTLETPNRFEAPAPKSTAVPGIVDLTNESNDVLAELGQIGVSGKASRISSRAPSPVTPAIKKSISTGINGFCSKHWLLVWRHNIQHIVILSVVAPLVFGLLTPSLLGKGI
jgi:hypothetical protein